MRRSQNGCGKNVAALNAAFIFSFVSGEDDAEERLVPMVSIIAGSIKCGVQLRSFRGVDLHTAN